MRSINTKFIHGVMFLSALLLAACGSGGGGSAPGGDGGTPGGQTFTVAGTVSNLSGTLVLHNGAEDLTVTKSGSFTFVTALANNSTYNVSVKTNPANQTCTITKNSGTISGANVTDVAVNCVSTNKSWTSPSPLSDFGITPEVANDPRVAMSNNGDAVVVWTQTDSSHVTQIYKAVYHNGAWIKPASATDHINVSNGRQIDVPQVAMDNNGNAIIVWVQNDGTTSRLYKSEYHGTTWTNPSALTEYINPAGDAVYAPKVAMDDNGNAIITWYQYDGISANHIYKSEYRNLKWTNPSSIDDHLDSSTVSSANPQVAMNNLGHAIIVWHQYDSSNVGNQSQIAKSEFRNLAWSASSVIKSSATIAGDAVGPHGVAMDNNGNAIIVWYQSDDDAITPRNHIYKCEYRSTNGAWGWTCPASLVSGYISTVGLNAITPQVAMGNNGDAVIVWEQADSTNMHGIFKSEYRNGSWPAAAPAETGFINNVGLDAYYPQVAMGNNGSAIVTWFQNSTVGTQVLQQIFKDHYRGGNWTVDSVSTVGNISGIAPVAMDDNGSAIITWYQHQASSPNYQILTSEYR